MSLIIFMRHGQAYNNVKRLLVGRHVESHLTEIGKIQVKKSSEYLKDIDIHKIYSSPVIRTIETSEIVSKYLDVPFELDERLFEIELGKLVGKYYDDLISVHGDLFSRFYCDDDNENTLKEFEVESFGSIRARVKDLIQDIIQKHENENVLLITHLDPIKAAISVIMNIKPSIVYNIHIPNASINVFRKYENTISLCALNILDVSRFISDF